MPASEPERDLPRHCYLAAEGPLDQAVGRKLLKEVSTIVLASYGGRGKDNLLERLPGFNQAAQRQPWLVLVDLDREDCAPSARAEWLPEPAERMCFGIVVPEVEAWLLGDREAVAEFLGVEIHRVPSAPESVQDPKALLVSLARLSKRRTLRDALVPRAGSGRQVGPGYSGALHEFVEKGWRPAFAAASCASLSRCRRRLAQLLSP
ncbi:MAG TPA: hypothetical protein PK413_12630 [Thermoanaerobaculia bacterium]|nr:hypothetical protein [Thermoanaerobaculia bacterium]